MAQRKLSTSCAIYIYVLELNCIDFVLYYNKTQAVKHYCHMRERRARQKGVICITLRIENDLSFQKIKVSQSVESV